MEVCFWQNMPSHLQSEVLRAFAELWPAKTHAVWCGELTEDRRQLGWQRSCFHPMTETVLPAEDYSSEIQRLLARHTEAVHVFSGLRAYPLVEAAFQRARQRPAARVALMVEAGIRMGVKGLLRPARAWYVARRYIPHVQLVLAMGNDGVQFYRNAGFPPGIVYPFMYQPPRYEELRRGPARDPVRLIYIGKLVRRKGVDVLLRGLSRTECDNWKLTIVGDGPEAAQHRGLARRCGVAQHIDWRGAISSDRIHDLLIEHDLCIVPSRFEGWGVVTNEAIGAGVPVICSDRVASRELVENSGAGSIFPSAHPHELAKALDRYLSTPARIEAAAARAREFRDRLHPRRVAQYLADVLRHCYANAPVRPQPPWANPC